MFQRPFWLLLLLLVQQPAQDAQPAPPQEGDAGETPFEPSPELLRALTGDETPRREDFERLERYPSLPAMHLRGYVKMKARDAPAALIEIDGVGHLTVHEGEHVTLNLPWKHVSVATPPAGAAREPGALLREQLPIALRIERIEPSGVTVEVGTLSERMVIR